MNTKPSLNLSWHVSKNEAYMLVMSSFKISFFINIIELSSNVNVTYINERC